MVVYNTANLTKTVYFMIYHLFCDVFLFAISGGRDTGETDFLNVAFCFRVVAVFIEADDYNICSFSCKSVCNRSSDSAIVSCDNRSFIFELLCIVFI